MGLSASYRPRPRRPVCLFVKCRKGEHAWVRAGAVPVDGRRRHRRVHWRRSPRPPEVAVRKWLLVLAVVAVLGTTLIVWSAAEDARRATLLDTRLREAHDRYQRLEWNEIGLHLHGAPREDVAKARAEKVKAGAEVVALQEEQWRRESSWHACLLRDVRRLTGW